MEKTWQECSIIIACFNEEKTIENCIREVNHFVPGAEIIVVVGGNDQTSTIAKRVGKEISNVKVIENRPDYGKGHATKVGILSAKNKFQAEIDADLQFDPKDLSSILLPLMDGRSKFINGTRHLNKKKWKSEEAKNFFRDYGNNILAWIFKTLTGVTLTDLTAGFHAWDGELVKSIWFDDDDFLYMPELIVRIAAAGEKIIEVPISYSDRKFGESKMKNNFEVTIMGFKMITNIVKVWFAAFVKKQVRAKSYPNASSKITKISLS